MRKEKKKKILNLTNGGFTLTELLATILVLAIIFSITIYIAIGVIGRAKENTYTVTVNNVVSNSNTYLIENTDKVSFVTRSDDASVEYQCLTVQNLIDAGYLNNNVLKSKISENETVQAFDYVYVERNKQTKAITKNEYVRNGDTTNPLASVCGITANAKGTISFASVEDPNTYTREKTIHITYKIMSLGSAESIASYGFLHTFHGVNNDYPSEGAFDNFTITKEVTVDSEGDLEANIIYGDKSIVSSVYHISKIDRTGPTITLTNEPTGYVSDTATYTLNVKDAKSGVNYNSFTKDDLAVSIGGNNITSFTLTKGSNGNYTLTVNDTAHTGAIVITVKANSIMDKLENTNKETTFNPGALWKFKVTAPTAADYCLNPTYNGNSQAVVKAAGTGYAWEGATNGTDAGTYNVIAKLNDGYMWSDKTITDKSLSCSIKKANATIVCNDKTYNGANQTIATCTGGTVNNATQKNVGNYTVTCTGDKNHNDAASATCKIMAAQTSGGGGGGGAAGASNCGSSWSTTMDCGNGKTASATCKSSVQTQTYQCPHGYGAQAQVCVTVCSSSCRSTSATVLIKTVAACPTCGNHAHVNSSNVCTCDSGYTGSATSGCTYEQAGRSCTKNGVSGTMSNDGECVTKKTCSSGQYLSGDKCLNCPYTSYSTCVTATNGSYACQTLGTNCYRRGALSCYSGYANGGGYCYKTTKATTKKTTTKSSGGGCFLANTKIMTSNGYKNINEIKMGDMVLSYNEITGFNTYHKVTHTFEFNPDELDETLYTLTLDDNETLKVTSSHNIYIERDNNEMWLATKEVKINDIVKYSDGTKHKIINISDEELTQKVYNLSVDNTHNYYVGDMQLLVHNVTINEFGKMVKGVK